MLAFILRRFFCLLVLSFALTACDRTSEDKASQGTSAEAAQWGAHIADYPKRWVATDAPLFIRFTHPVVDQSQLNQPRAKLVSLSPQLPVTAVFTAVDELRITPHERLPGDQVINVQLHNHKLLGVDEDLPPFEFSVHTIKQDFDLNIGGLVSDPANSEQMLLQGQITTADRAHPKAVEKVLQATLRGEQIPVMWQAQGDGKTFGFTLTNI